MYYKRMLDKAFTALLINKNSPQDEDGSSTIGRIRNSDGKQLSPSAFAADPIVPFDHPAGGGHRDLYDLMDKEMSNEES